MSRSALTPREARSVAFARPLDNWATSRRSRLLLAVVLVAATVRIVLALIAGGDIGRSFIVPDSYEYDRLAVNLASGHGFSQAATSPFVPDVRRTPVYPLILAILYAIGGHRPVVGAAVGVVLGILACVLTAELGRSIYGEAVGIIAGFLLAVDEVSAAYSLMLMTETLFTVLILLATLHQSRYIQRRRMGWAISSAIWTGTAILARPIGLFLPLVCGPILAWITPSQSRRARVLLAVTVIGVGMAFPVAWTLRNYLATGLAQPTSLIAINSYYYRAVPLEGKSSDHTLPPLAGGSQDDETPQVLRAMESRSVQIILADPAGYAVLHATGVLRMLGPDRDALGQLLAGAPAAIPATTLASFISETVHTRHPETQGIILGIEFAQIGIVYILALLGTWAGLRHMGRSRHTLLIWSLIGYFLVISGPEAYPRFRVPIMPFVSILAALGLRTLWPNVRALARFDSSGSRPLDSSSARGRA